MERVEPEPCLELGVVCRAQGRVRGAESFACRRGLALGRDQPLPVGGVRGLDLAQRQAGAGLGRSGRGHLGAEGIALCGAGPFTLAERQDLAVGACHPLLGDDR